MAAHPVTEAERAAAAARRDAHALAATLSLQESADVLGVDPSEVERRCSDGQLWAVDVQGEQRIPCWQFVGGRLLPGLSAVIAAIPPGTRSTLSKPGFMPVSKSFAIEASLTTWQQEADPLMRRGMSTNSHGGEPPPPGSTEAVSAGSLRRSDFESTRFSKTSRKLGRRVLTPNSPRTQRRRVRESV